MWGHCTPVENRICGPGFNERVYEVVRRVPPGRVTTYGDVASVLGSPRVARQVGWALSSLPADTDVPWQRVINARGMVSGRGEIGRAEVQEALLREEGVDFDERGRCDLKALRWEWSSARLACIPHDPGDIE